VNPAQFILISALHAYRWALSPAKAAWFGPSGRCRFTPTCSQYALAAIRQHGAWRGSWLALARIGRCHPWGDCGHDPVPEGKIHGSRFTMQAPPRGRSPNTLTQRTVGAAKRRDR